MPYEKYEPIWKNIVKSLNNDESLAQTITAHVNGFRDGFGQRLFRADFIDKDENIREHFASPRYFSSTEEDSAKYFSEATRSGHCVVLLDPPRHLRIADVRCVELTKLLYQKFNCVASEHAIQHGCIPRLIRSLTRRRFDAIHEVGIGYGAGAELLVVKPLNFAEQLKGSWISQREANLARANRTFALKGLKFSQLIT